MTSTKEVTGRAIRRAVSMATLALASCSESDSPPPPDIAPVVSAGADQAVDESAEVFLTGAVNDPDSAPSVAWTQIGGPAVMLSAPSTLTPSFTAPFVDADVTLTFRLTANDSVNPPVPDEVSVVVRDLGSQVFFVDAQATDAAISAGRPHMIAPPSGPGPGEGKLLVFFPGTGGAPENNSIFIEHAATLGYHSIGLSYQNDISVISICTGAGPGAGDPDCQRNMRTENFTGVDASSFIDVTPANSIRHRIEALLAYLQGADPDGGWQDFLAAGAVNWRLVALSGHSQGGGHAAFISKQELVDRALLFASTEPANWTLDIGLTPGASLFGFVDEHEDNATPVELSWSQLGLPGPLTNIDAGPPPPGGSHRLTTARLDCNGASGSQAFHGCVVTDQFTPRNPDGSPLFAPIWDYMLGLGD